jgi:hypothetical protein
MTDTITAQFELGGLVPAPPEALPTLAMSTR